jgi:Ca2+-binding EF-hand superfamily protein
MNKWPAFAVILLAAFPAWAQPTYNPEKNADDQMRHWDSNKNGIVEWSEYSRAAAYRFSRMDADGNDIISLQEMADYQHKKVKHVKLIIKRWDTDRNNEISREEYLRPVREQFIHLDKDQNNTLSRQELIDDWVLRKIELEKHIKKQREQE